MGDEKTQNLTDGRSFEERIFARFDALDARMSKLESRMDSLEGRMGALEDKVDRRLQETRPMWEAVQNQLERLNSKVDVLIKEFYEVKTDIVRLDKRVTSLEGQRA
jgi:chromosome segregation ATPase